MIFIWLLILACEVQSHEPEPLNHVTTNRCRSEYSGSTPACWNEQDWEAFCERVRCKPKAPDCWNDYMQCELNNEPTETK